ncbi:TetR/AcrR family transcriptional regulator [Neobacillus vireti]|uniref:TetR family transcriptional regulator n=1 Tax=Neobacillus vireti LMG 21834 TaxID=1131730 RepID=A0AB94IUS4_9BACI|nr:TetR/AcrR family transcriptional regulator [Neobacillus vireti]ETI70810.1 TetR family transcriptional regulator [Neobacillus vireti LMG 21834]
MKREQNMLEKRAKILEAAIPLFADNGLSATTVATIAKQAGVGFGTVFNYFATKEDLFKAAVLEPLDEQREILKQIVMAQGTPHERLKKMVICHLHHFSHHRNKMRLMLYVLGQPERFPEIAEELFAFARDFFAAVVPIVEEGQTNGEIPACDPLGLSWSYFAYINGVVMTMLDPPDDPKWEQFILHGCRLFGITD